MPVMDVETCFVIFLSVCQNKVKSTLVLFYAEENKQTVITFLFI